MTGYEYLIGGYQGMAVIRTGWNEFMAYECTCPHDHGRLAMDKDYGNLVLRCPLCGSGFSTFGDGFPLDGSLTSCPLYHYNTYYDGAILYISTY
jgi:nitrite reductase/ring-hydroxylating ferredoxin subunit